MGSITCPLSSKILSSCLWAGKELQFPDGVYTSLTTILLQPKPGGTKSLNWRVALSPPKITVCVFSGVTNFIGKSESDSHQPYAMSKTSLDAISSKVVFLGTYNVWATP